MKRFIVKWQKGVETSGRVDWRESKRWCRWNQDIWVEKGSIRFEASSLDMSDEESDDSGERVSCPLWWNLPKRKRCMRAVDYMNWAQPRGPLACRRDALLGSREQTPLTRTASWAGAWTWSPTVPSCCSGPRGGGRSSSPPSPSPKPSSRKYSTTPGPPWTLMSANQVGVCVCGCVCVCGGGEKEKKASSLWYWDPGQVLFCSVV